MKKIIIIQLLANAIALPALANGLSRLSLTNYDHQKFVLYFDNSYFSTPSNTYNITDITPGRHHIRMMSPVAPQNQYGGWGMPQLFYDGYVNIPQSSAVTAYTQGDMFNITSTVTLYDPNGYDPNYNVGYGNAGGNGNGQWNGNGNGYDPYGYGNNGGYWGNNGGGYGNGCGNSSNNGVGNGNWNGNWNNQYYQGMSAAQFDGLKSTIASKSFDSSKLTVAEQAVATNYLTAAQVAELAKLFDFESTRLEFAKYAYGRTLDKGNYYQVNNAFDFESSITDLAGYVNSYHG